MHLVSFSQSRTRVTRGECGVYVQGDRLLVEAAKSDVLREIESKLKRIALDMAIERPGRLRWGKRMIEVDQQSRRKTRSAGAFPTHLRHWGSSASSAASLSHPGFDLLEKKERKPCAVTGS